MLCLYCSTKTAVVNSRSLKKTNTTWRRRKCSNCQATVTTKELIDLSGAVMVTDINDKSSAFNADILFLSIYSCCKHREKPIQDARGLSDTVIAKLAAKLSNTSITANEIASETLAVLKRFDKAAAVQYKAFHKAILR